MASTSLVAAGKEEPPVKRVKTETVTTATRTCQFCVNKKQVAANCVSIACKKCCLTRSQVCAAHPKDYGETVTIFCARDFFEIKKLSQGVLKDQERTQRVSGNAWGRRKKKNAVKSKIKQLIQCALGKRPAPVGYEDMEVLAKTAVGDASGGF